MVGLPEITLVGILVTDPELGITPTGATVATFTVAVNGRCYDPDTGQRIDNGTTFLPCAIRHHTADNVTESLTVGTRVLVTGVLRPREWEAIDGDQRYAYHIDATEVGICFKQVTVRVTKTTNDASSSTDRQDGSKPPP
jgi:single-strand DNA-binding protein